jgi:hypothetical protein
MISSHDEFCLLLNKWMSESKELFAVISYHESQEAPPRCLSVVVGVLADLTNETLSIKGDNGNAVLVQYSDCQFIYESDFGGWGAAYLTGRKFEDVFVLAIPGGLSIAIGAATSLASSSD